MDMKDINKLYEILGRKHWAVLDALVEKAGRADDLEKIAYVDALTGLKNRRFYDELITSEVSRANREGKYDLSLIIGDIDKFKPFNDIYGHKAGDKVLKEVAEVSKNSLGRPSDVAARYGGEEIAFVLPGTNYDGAMYVAERVRGNIEKNVMEFQDEDGKTHYKPVTMSMGVATFRKGDSIDTIFERADSGLYLAKDWGRNRVVGKN